MVEGTRLPDAAIVDNRHKNVDVLMMMVELKVFAYGLGIGVEGVPIIVK